MSRWQKILVAWSVVALGAAEYIRHIRLSGRAQIVLGAIEVTLAIATGVCFGIATLRKTS